MKREKKKKATALEAAARRNTLKNLILGEGYGYSQIVEYCKAEWNIGQGQASAYLRQIRKEFERECTRMGYGLGYHLAMRNDLIRKAYKDGDLVLALKALDSMARLTGVMKLQTEKEIDAMTPEEREKHNYVMKLMTDHASFGQPRAEA